MKQWRGMERWLGMCSQQKRKERGELRGERIGGREEDEESLCNQSMDSYSVCSDKDNQF